MKDWNKRNGLEYMLMKETEEVQLFSVNGGTSYEVSVLVYRKPRKLPDGKISPEGYHTPSNEEFGRSGNKSKVFYNKKSAINYFNELTK